MRETMPRWILEIAYWTGAVGVVLWHVITGLLQIWVVLSLSILPVVHFELHAIWALIICIALIWLGWKRRRDLRWMQAVGARPCMRLAKAALRSMKRQSGIA